MGGDYNNRVGGVGLQSDIIIYYHSCLLGFDTKQQNMQTHSFSISFQKRRSMAIQCGVKTADMETQTKRLLNLPSLSNRPDDVLNESLMSVGSDDPRDPDWEPQDDSESEDIMDVEMVDNEINEAKEPKYIVFESCLDQLLKQCVICGSGTCVEKKVLGTCLICTIKCLSCGNITDWRSQPWSGNLPVGNLLLSAGIMFSGGNAAKFLRVLDFISVRNICVSTYNKIQSAYLTPTILEVWQNHQEAMITSIQGQERDLRLAGDMRCCSPGHTAKYGSYTMIDLEVGMVLDIQLVQVMYNFNPYNILKPDNPYVYVQGQN